MNLDLTRAQALAESLMRDTCVVTRGAPLVAADEDFDETTGEYTTPAGSSHVVYTGKCMIQVATEASSTDRGTTVPLPSGRYRLMLPLSAPEVAPDDLARITKATDQRLLARQFRVLDRGQAGTFMVLRDVAVEELRVGV